MPEDASDQIVFNGIDGTTGQYLLEPMSLGEAAGLAREKVVDAYVLDWLKGMWRTLSQPHLGLPFFVDPADYTQAGWGVVFHNEEDKAVTDALQPLIDHRKQRITDTNRCKILEYKTGEDWSSWLARNGVAAGNVDPKKVPFYLLLVGSPDRIPFSFGHLLDVEYAVGRLHFDTAAEYAAYAASVIDYETSAAVPTSKEAVFFAPRHAFDSATQLSADLLVKPLIEGDPSTGFSAITEYGEFRSRQLWGAQATKNALTEVFHTPAADKPPAFLFTAGHGMGWPSGDPRQLNYQGALVCQDWPGLGQINADHYFGASDLTDDGRVGGMITFHFACYGAGTPDRDRFVHKPGQPPPVIAGKPFFSALPKRLLTHPKGGALAVIGHVERAWAYSIVTKNAGPQLIPFQNTIGRLMKGDPIGYAMKDFNERYAALSTNLSDLQEKISFGQQVANQVLASTWIERNDAEGYVVLGDPAVRLRVQDMV